MKNINFEDILCEVGDYGHFQKNLMKYFLIPSVFVFGLAGLSILFLVPLPKHWCYVPEVASSNLSAVIKRTIISPPGEDCSMYNINFTNILVNETYIVPKETPTKPCNHGWQYDTSNYDSTVATKWNLVCDDFHYISFVLTAHGAGSIVGTAFYGALSDKVGRKATFFIIILVSSIAGIASILVQDFTTFVILKTIHGCLIPSAYQQSYIIVLELISQEMRTRVNAIVHFAWSSGMCFLPLVAYFSRSWIILSIVSISTTIVLLLYWSFLPESPRWLISQEKYDDAKNVMLQIAKRNGNKPDETSLNQKIKILGEKLQKEKINGVKNSPWDLIRYPQLRKIFFIITCCWTANQMSYYGLQLNCSNLTGNEFINFFLLSLVEIPSYLAFPMVTGKVGRRWCNALGFMLTAIACWFATIKFNYTDVICSMIGKFFAAGTFMTTYQQTSELYPTVVLSLGMGMSCTIAMVLNLAVPYLFYLRIYMEEIPLLVIGLCSLLTGFLATFLPETLDENLPQSILEAENFGTSQRYFSWIKKGHVNNREERTPSSNDSKDSKRAKDNNIKDCQNENISKTIKNNITTETASAIENSIEISTKGKVSISKVNNQECYEVFKKKPKHQNALNTDIDKDVSLRPISHDENSQNSAYENVAFVGDSEN